MRIGKKELLIILILSLLYVLFFTLINIGISIKIKKPITITNTLEVKEMIHPTKFVIFEDNGVSCRLYLNGKEVSGTVENNKVVFESIPENIHNIKIVCNAKMVDSINFFRLKEGKDYCQPYFVKDKISLKQLIDILKNIEYDTSINPSFQILTKNPIFTLRNSRGSCGEASVIFHDVLCQHGIDNSVVVGFLIDNDNVYYHVWNIVEDEFYVDAINEAYYFNFNLVKIYTVRNKNLFLKKDSLLDEGLISVTPILFSDGLFEIEKNKIEKT